jgi:hypothetical protein
MRAVTAAGPSRESIKELGASPHGVGARWPVLAQHLRGVPNQQPESGSNKKKSETFHSFLHVDIGGELRELRPSWSPRASGRLHEGSCE